MLGKVISKEVVAEDTLQVMFQLSETVEFKAGQYFFVKISAGRKHFSINNPPLKNDLLALTTRLTGSDFKNNLNELKVGDDVELGPIAGDFVLPEVLDKGLVFIAGGIGITPFLSMIGFLVEKDPQHEISLVWSNRNKASSPFLEQLQSLTQVLPNLKLIFTMTEDNAWIGEKRKVDTQFIKDYFPNYNSNYYFVAGPPGMVEVVEKTLKEVGIQEENIKVENFTGY